MPIEFDKWVGQFDFTAGDNRPATEVPIKGVATHKTQFAAVRFMRWQAMTSKRPTENTAAIMVLNPDTPEVTLRYKHILILRFWDHARLDLIDGLLARYLGGNPALCVSIRASLRRDSGWPWRPPLAADAQAVSGFLEALPPEITELDVACEYGRSRSRAIAEWVALGNGVEAEGNRAKGRPNPRLTYLLRNQKK